MRAKLQAYLCDCAQHGRGLDDRVYAGSALFNRDGLDTDSREAMRRPAQ